MGRVMAVDFGEKRTGIAISDRKKRIAFPKEIVETSIAIRRIKEIVKKEDVEEIVVGYPLNLQGKRTGSTKRAEMFYERLKELVRVPVVLMDERLTSKFAEKFRIKKKRPTDDVAASILLSDYLRRRYS